MLDYVVKSTRTDFEDVMAFMDVINKEDDIVELNREFQRILNK